MSDEISRDRYDALARIIESHDSPMGIDAKKTHILVLHKLEEIERRLAEVERRLSEAPGR